MRDFVEPANLIDCSTFPEIEKWGSSLAATHGGSGCWAQEEVACGGKPTSRVTESASVSKSHRVVRHVSFRFRHVPMCGFLDIILIAKT